MNAKPRQEFLYNLLPEYFRSQDYYKGEPLRALMGVLESEYWRLHDGIQSHYGDWFIETCDTQIIPCIGDLVGVEFATALLPAVRDLRSRVGNATRYARRKGTADALERVIGDSTGWPAIVVEFSALLATTHQVRDTWSIQPGFVNLRDNAIIDHIGGPLDRSQHRPNLRTNSDDQLYGGKYNIPFVGIYLWRLQACSITDGAPSRLQNQCFTFSPFGLNTPLFSVSQSRDILGAIPGNAIPGPITRRALDEEIRSRTAGETPQTAFLGEFPSLEIRTSSNAGAMQPVRPEQMTVADLSDWGKADAADGEAKVVVDPETGRIRFPRTFPTDKIAVRYAYGAASTLGSGLSSPPDFDTEPTVNRTVAEFTVVVADPGKQEGNQEVRLLAAQCSYAPEETERVLIFNVASNWTYRLPKPCVIEVKRSQVFVIRGLRGQCPVLDGDIEIDSGHHAATVVLSGLWIKGTIRLRGPVALRIENCTLAPLPLGQSQASIAMTENAVSGDFSISLSSSVTGAIELPPEASIQIENSIVDGGRGAAIGKTDGRGPATSIFRSTVLGTITAETLDATDSILVDRVQVRNVGNHCIRYCFVPTNSHTPPRYRCQPDSALVRPVFTSTMFGTPGYMQLGMNCSEKIRAGAENGSEMGVFHDLQQPLRLQQLQATLEEFLPIGLEPQQFFMT